MTDHVVMAKGGLRCEHCKAFQPVAFPVLLGGLERIGRPFFDEHKRCKPSAPEGGERDG